MKRLLYYINVIFIKKSNINNKFGYCEKNYKTKGGINN